MIKKVILFVLSVLVAWGPAVFAKTMYTSDITEISLRQGRDTSYPIIKTLKSNELVTVLESSNGWSKIQLADGKEGWLVTSYLTDKTPGSAASPETEKNMDQMALQLKAAGEENERLKKEIQSLKTQMDSDVKNPGDLRGPTNPNPVESEGFLALKAKFDQISAESQEKAHRISKLQQQLADAGKNPGNNKCYLYLFLAGAGVLLLGMIIGASNKRRRSSLL